MAFIAVGRNQLRSIAIVGMTNYRIGPHRTCGREMRENWGK